ncbi:hypothetical protein MRX96_000028 [Rhipicephalus microplus]
MNPPQNSLKFRCSGQLLHSDALANTSESRAYCCNAYSVNRSPYLNRCDTFARFFRHSPLRLFSPTRHLTRSALNRGCSAFALEDHIDYKALGREYGLGKRARKLRKKDSYP